MNEIETGGPAFPLQDWDQSIQSRRSETGMTLRDYFAAKAMVTIWNHAHAPRPDSVHQAAEWCYAMADAMLRERKA